MTAETADKSGAEQAGYLFGSVGIPLILIGIGCWLLATAAKERKLWEDHRQQVQMMQQWHLAQQGAPFNQFAPAPPQVTSPYAGPPGHPGVPLLPPKPGGGKLIWGWVLIAVGVLMLLATLSNAATSA